MLDSIELSLFVSRMEAICQEMGVVLRRTAFSPNIKDRLDFSCALFDARGGLCAQAAHIPVHLGSMAFAMADLVGRFDWRPGDVVILNDPFMGGTHLPDVTVVCPLFVERRLLAFVVNRAHHANIGSPVPGSMPNSRTLEEEGLLIEPRLLYRAGEPDHAFLRELELAFGSAGDSGEAGGGPSGDLAAQYSANQVGLRRLAALVEKQGAEAFSAALAALNEYGETLARATLQQLPRGSWHFRDLMDDDGQGTPALPIVAQLTLDGEHMQVDFTGSAAQVPGNINCPLAVTAAAVYYVFRCLLPEQAPACAGLFSPLRIIAPAGSLLNALPPAAVAAGNVETSSRIVDVLLGALQQALPESIPAASQGTMNNVAMGARGADGNWDYYETLAGGTGAGPCGPGRAAVHSHMTNTLNTPVESLELHYPLRVRRYQLRRGSGGSGKYRGGDGLLREYEFLQETTVSLLSERRLHAPWGVAGGTPGQPGRNLLNGEELPGKTMFTAQPGDRLCIETPGGGGWGKA